MTDGSDTLKRVPELWFDDGNIVFQAENRQFRLHKSIIALRSSVFKEILSVQSIGKEEDLVDDCVVIQLSDGAILAEFFFTAIYYPSSFEPNPGFYSSALAMFIGYMSNKYKVRDLRSRALSHLDLGFPSTLEAYDGPNEFGKLNMNAIGLSLLAWELCMLMDTPWLLPTAIYLLCRHPLIEVIGHQRWKALDETQKEACIRNSISHSQESIRLLDIVQSTSSPDCPDQVACALEREDHLLVIKKCLQDPYLRQDPLGYLRYIGAKPTWHCKNCNKKFKRRVSRSREKLWRKLPAMYGLEDWEKLLEKRSLAFK
ncbi:hypothetical protein B0H34DRAFT_668990 [Crassisporium funariophilum]|nr:hypothetical protein B0H34DRAFT_668990 [Crassisporium funariophilum]